MSNSNTTPEIDYSVAKAPNGEWAVIRWEGMMTWVMATYTHKQDALAAAKGMK